MAVVAAVLMAVAVTGGSALARDELGPKAVSMGEGQSAEIAPPPAAPAAAASPASVRVVRAIDYKMVYIAPGTFMMGSSVRQAERDADETRHRVTLTKGFYMGATEVTQGQWATVMGINPSVLQNGGDHLPVDNISWNAVQEFVRRLNAEEGTTGYRLPTEAEWEYAARAGTTTPFAFGDCLAADQANHNGNYPLKGCAKGLWRQKTVAVGSFSPNAWGLHDMHGNVWEWCQDWYGKYPTGAVTDPKGPTAGEYRVVRGGSWGSFARGCRSANRYSGVPAFRSNVLGLRLCMSLP
jgi:formylglycine-generating enzyme required for sulfatase activity